MEDLVLEDKTQPTAKEQEENPVEKLTGEARIDAILKTLTEKHGFVFPPEVLGE